MITADLCEECGARQAKELRRLPAVPPGVPEHGGDLPPLDRFQRLGRWSTFAQGLSQTLKIELGETQIQDEKSGSFSWGSDRSGSEKGGCRWAVGFGGNGRSGLAQRLSELLGAGPVTADN